MLCFIWTSKWDFLVYLNFQVSLTWGDCNALLKDSLCTCTFEKNCLVYGYFMVRFPKINLFSLASLNFVPGLPIQCPGWSYMARCHSLVQLNSQVGLPLSSRLPGETLLCLNLHFRFTFMLRFVSLLHLYWPFMIEQTLWMNLPGACTHPD